MALLPEVRDSLPWSHVYVALAAWGFIYLWVVIGSAIITFGGRLLQSDFKRRRGQVFQKSTSKVGSVIFRIEERLFHRNKMVERGNVPIPVRIVLYCVQVILSLMTASMAGYISSYSTSPRWWDRMAFVCFCFFIFHFVVRAVSSSRPLVFFVLLPLSAIDSFSIISMYFSYDSAVSFMFLRSYLAAHSFKVLLRLLLPPTVFQSLSTQIANLVVESLSLIYSFSMIVFILETIGNPPGVEEDPSEFTLFAAVYFIFITLTTVGYGDFTAKSYGGRIAVILMVIFGIALFAEHLSKLVEYLAASQMGLGSFHNTYDEPYVILCGDIKFGTIVDFVKALRHKDSIVDYFDFRRKVVVLTQSTEIIDSGVMSNLSFFQKSSPEFENSVVVLQGSPFNAVDLVHRAAGRKAQGIFVLSDLYSADPQTSDTANILRAMAVHKRVKVPVYLSVTDPIHMLEAGHPVIENALYSTGVKMELFAMSIFGKGAAAFLCTAMMPILPSLGTSSTQAQKEFCDGAEKEFYVVGAPAQFVGQEISATCYHIFQRSGVLVVGVASPQEDRFVFQYHSEGKLLEGSAFLLLASDIRHARSIVLIDPLSPEEVAVELEMQALPFDQRNSGMSKPLGMWAASKIMHSAKKRRTESQQHLFEDIDICLPLPSRQEKGHVAIVCSHTNGIAAFLGKLRAIETSSGVEEHTVVVLSEEPFRAIDFAGIPSSYLKGVKFMQGLFVPELFYKCRLGHASQVILLNLNPLSKTSVAEDVPDLAVVSCWFKIKQFLDMPGARDPSRPKPQILIELHDERSLKFFDGSPSSDAVEQWSTGIHAAGEVVSLAVVPRLLIAAHLNPGFMFFFKNILLQAGVSHNMTSFTVASILPTAPTYGPVFHKLLVEKNYFPVGLYRNQDHSHCDCPSHSLVVEERAEPAAKPYLYTAPPLDLPVCSKDQVLCFVPAVSNV